jgi:small subunit ribosomal protein S18
MAKVAPKRGKNKDNARRSKKKTSVLNTERIDYVDYKDVNLLRRFMSDRAKIRARRVTGNDSQQQKEIARAIKNAREMALLPYANRVTTQRGGGRDRGERGDRGDRGDRNRADGPPPRPEGPPPVGGTDGDELEITGIDVETAEGDVLVDVAVEVEGDEQ